MGEAGGRVDRNRKLRELASKSKVLLVGAGGIGCEVLKNLVLAGFGDVHVIDLDTIDVSNLNRQFLFHKQHVGKSKAQVARESALRFNPNASIKAYHGSIMTNEYGVGFFESFTLVMNALDNRAARNHVNRMCLAADVPLIESGTSGYSGQVELIKKTLTQCYECQPKAPQKSFPGCTIRNTPSEPIHCIVWAKHLFNQLFGEEDSDHDVSPDTEDPEAAGDASERALQEDSSNSQGNIQRSSTRAWANACKYDPTKLFNKLFRDDILYLLTMHNLWKNRRAPTPLDINKLPDAVVGTSRSSESGLKDQRIWSIAECAKIFADSCYALKDSLASLNEGDHLVWDKDDKSAMDFVAACANIRAHIFGIQQNTRFDIKSMAGNIVPAIATANAIIAGIVVMHAFNILMNEYEKCQSVYLRLQLNPRGYLFVPDAGLTKPNPKCYVCQPKPSVMLICNVDQLTCAQLNSAVLIGSLNMIAPDALLEGQGVVLISSEEGETDNNKDKTLQELKVVDGSVLIVDDFHQDYQIRVIIQHDPECKEFKVIADPDSLKPNENGSNGNGSAKNHDDEQPSSSKQSTASRSRDNDSDMEVIEDEDININKRKKPEDSDEPPTKKTKLSITPESDMEEIIDIC